MKHRPIRKKILRYLDDDLSVREKQKVRHHLENCQVCRDALKMLESMWVVDRPIERQTAPPFLWTRIAARLQSQTEQKPFKGLKNPVRWVLRPVMTVGVLIIIIFSGVKLGNLTIESSRDGTEISTKRITDNFGSSCFEILPPGFIDAHVFALTESERQE